jgi:hypothetical protein
MHESLLISRSLEEPLPIKLFPNDLDIIPIRRWHVDGFRLRGETNLLFPAIPFTLLYLLGSSHTYRFLTKTVHVLKRRALIGRSQKHLAHHR